MHFLPAAYDSWFDYTNDWENVVKNNPDIPVLNLYFEDMKKVEWNYNKYYMTSL